MRIVLSALCIEFLILASSYDHPCRRSVCSYTWSEWSACSCRCGSGCTMTRTGRTDHSGGCCPHDSTTQTVACNTDPSLCLNGGSQNHHGCSCSSGWTGTCCGIGKWLTVFLPVYSISFNSANNGKFFWSWIRKKCVEVQEKKIVVLCSRPPQNVKIGSFTL